MRVSTGCAAYSAAKQGWIADPLLTFTKHTPLFEHALICSREELLRTISLLDPAGEYELQRVQAQWVVTGREKLPKPFTTTVGV